MKAIRNLFQVSLLCTALLLAFSSGAQPIIKVAAGEFHTLFLKSDGSLWAMGDNVGGQLGDGTFNFTNLPEEIISSNVTDIAAGAYHSLFIKSDGSLWTMGLNTTFPPPLTLSPPANWVMATTITPTSHK